MVYKAANKDSDEPSRDNEVSSAYCDIYCVLFIYDNSFYMFILFNYDCKDFSTYNENI